VPDQVVPAPVQDGSGYGKRKKPYFGETVYELGEDDHRAELLL
jgi:hypothetical protein